MNRARYYEEAFEPDNELNSIPVRAPVHRDIEW